MTDADAPVRKRLEALEKEARRWRRAGAATAAMILALMTLAAARPKPRLVEAGEFRLVDEKGTVRASLTARKSAAALMLADEAGTVRARLALEGSPRMELSDAGGTTQASVSLGADGAPTLSLGAEKQARATVRIGSDGASDLTLTDGNDHARAALALAADGSPRVALYDEEGSLRASLGATPLKELRSGASEKTPPSSLVLFDKKGGVVFKAPK